MSKQTEPTSLPIRIASETAAVRPTDSLSDRVRSLQLDNDLSEARSRRPDWLWLLIVVLVFGEVGLGYQVWQMRKVQQPAQAEAAQQPSASKTSSTGSGDHAGSAATGKSASTAAASSSEIVHEAKGYIIPAHQILVSPKVSGMIEKLFVEEGKRVKKDDVLAQLETIDYRAERDRAAALLALSEQRLLELERGNRPEEIEQAKAERAEAEAQRVQLELTWKRSQQLRKTNIISDAEYEQAESAYLAMDKRVEKLKNALKLMIAGPRQERIDAARAEVGQAKADLAKAQWRLDNCTIRAPITGTILTKKAEEGNIVNPIAFNGSFSIAEMADLSDLEVDLSIQERDIAKIAVGQTCIVRSDAFPDRKYDGIVSRLMPIADRSKGAVNVRVKVTIPAEEEGVYLKPEMSALVVFLKGKSS